MISKDLVIPSGISWHKQLIDLCINENVLSENMGNVLGQYLAFRHFFTHAYALDLYSEKMEPLVENAMDTYSLFKNELTKYL